MAYTEVKKRKGRKYYYRVLSVRKGKKVSKKRKYLGLNLSKKDLNNKEKEADSELKEYAKIKIDKRLEKIKNKIKNVLKKNKVKRAGIFGSYARGEQKKNSDIDILVDIRNPNMSLLGFINLNHKIEDILGKKVDLVEYAAIKPLIKDRILNEEVRII